MRLFRSIVVGSAFLIVNAMPAGVSILSNASSSTRDVVARDWARSAVVPMLGISGKLRAVIGLPEVLTQDSAMGRILAQLPIGAPGVHPLGLDTEDGGSLVVVSMERSTPGMSATPTGYRTGRWPSRGLPPGRDSVYAPPSGFILVTIENQDTPVSKQFRLRDFLTHDQQDVWPKALVLRTALVDKLELISEGLERRGLPSALHVESGFRTPQYNAIGVGDPGATHSRHMYGDAADVYVDADRDGRMDDLDGDGRTTVADAKVLLAVAETVEISHPELVGGLSAYSTSAAHGAYVHVDARGVRARW